MGAVPVSVYLITKNEEPRIERAIRSVSTWADEVIVVDSGSDDRTVEVAEEAGARVLFREWDGYGPQKRFAEQQCRNEWVLNLDADEEVTSGLAEEILNVVKTARPDQAAFSVRVTDLLPGETEPHWLAYSYNVPRLYNTNRGQMSLHQYQDRIEVREGRTSALRGRILHRSFISWETTVRKINFYSSQVAEQRAAGGRKRPATARIWFEFPATFFKVWLGRRYIFRGTMGFAMSLTVAYLNVLRLLKTVERISASQPTSAAQESGPSSELPKAA